MLFYSTRQQSPLANLQQAVMQGLPADNGLYMPQQIGQLPASFFAHIEQQSFADISFAVARCLLQDSIPATDLEQIVRQAINFDAPLVTLDHQTACLELTHGPSLAFKDFGARFMAAMMGYYVQQTNRKLYILVATSGDTGGAVAQGFLGIEGIEVIILYPSQRISLLQEKQLTTLGSNITALEIEGSFDDCQDLVKQAFLDPQLQQALQLSSANSINLARLVPQAFYYVYGYAQAKKMGKPLVYCVPSGNFGNLTAGLLAKRIGTPIRHFVAANNANNVFTQYHRTEYFEPRASVSTLSNAMDVGNPSNLQRIQHLYQNNMTALRNDISAYDFDDQQTIQAMKSVYEQYGYVMCPHTAVAYLGIKNYREQHPNEAFTGVFLSTAHPAKFIDTVESSLHIQLALPPNLAKLADRPKVATLMPARFEDFKRYLLQLA